MVDTHVEKDQFESGEDLQKWIKNITNRTHNDSVHGQWVGVRTEFTQHESDVETVADILDFQFYSLMLESVIEAAKIWTVYKDGNLYNSEYSKYFELLNQYPEYKFEAKSLLDDFFKRVGSDIDIDSLSDYLLDMGNHNIDQVKLRCLSLTIFKNKCVSAFDHLSLTNDEYDKYRSTGMLPRRKVLLPSDIEIFNNHITKNLIVSILNPLEKIMGLMSKIPLDWNNPQASFAQTVSFNLFNDLRNPNINTRDPNFLHPFEEFFNKHTGQRGILSLNTQIRGGMHAIVLGVDGKTHVILPHLPPDTSDPKDHLQMLTILLSLTFSKWNGEHVFGNGHSNIIINPKDPSHKSLVQTIEKTHFYGLNLGIPNFIGPVKSNIEVLQRLIPQLITMGKIQAVLS